MTNATENYTPEITLEVGSSSAQIFLPFMIVWQNQEYHGTFIVYLTQKRDILDYEFEWSEKTPNFGEFESYMYEKLGEDLLEEAFAQYGL